MNKIRKIGNNPVLARALQHKVKKDYNIKFKGVFGGWYLPAKYNYYLKKYKTKYNDTTNTTPFTKLL
jgi:hypothetical protein|tara:strand:- start:281 stop:481 length:201 start_codon:yes stop_codon:yes gene_type:complete